MKGRDLVVFLGPSLSAEEAQRITPCTVLPPARQGDVWRALSRKPRAIVLIDGVFESVPSVWHHELLDALKAGVAVFGASSMGALRAAELASHGMRGVGRIFEQYADGTLNDDADVALLHAPAEFDYRAITVPLVTVREIALRARKAKVLSPRKAEQLVDCASALFYQERTWPTLYEALGWDSALRDRLRGWLAEHPVDPKAEDARSCLHAAAKWGQATFLESGRDSSSGISEDRRLPDSRRSALVRRRRLYEDETRIDALGIRGDAIVRALWGRKDAEDLATDGLRRALLAAWARSLGLSVPSEEIDAEVRRRFRRADGPELGLDDAGLRALIEDELLENLLLRHSERLLPEGIGVDEALAAEARRRGVWTTAAQRLARGKRGGR